jgi:DNA polymerase III subunit delta'
MQFREITGQKEIKKKLIQTVLDQRISHAQLFFGQEGSEKLALAIAYAQFINCTNRQFPPVPPVGGRAGDGGFPDSCGICPSCIKYRKLIHPDLHFIYPVATTKKVTRKPQSKDFIEEWRKFLLQTDYYGSLHDWFEFIGIENKQGIINAEDCHDIITTLSYKSYESEYKVMVIWMVEKLYYAAAPKILKILEEPPEKTLFLLICEDPEQIISTILSRTLLVKIPRTSQEEIRKYLETKFSVAPKEAETIARQANGNLQLAVKKYQLYEEDQGNFRMFRDWMRLCFAKDIAGLVNFSGELSKIGRENQKNLLHYALQILQSCARLQYTQDRLVLSAGEEMEFIKKISPFINSSNFTSFHDLFNNALYHIERNAYPQTLFMDVSLNILQLFAKSSKK